MPKDSQFFKDMQGLYSQKKWSKRPENAPVLAGCIEQGLQLLCNKEGDFHIVLQSKNYSDGIGDFKNLLDYYLWMKAIFFGFPGVKIKAFAYVSTHKYNLATFILPEVIGKVYKYATLDVSKKTTKEQWSKIPEADLILFTGHRISFNQIVSKQVDDLIAHSPYLVSFLKKTRFLFNIATPLASTHNVLMKFLPEKCWIRSRLEYEPSTNESHFSQVSRSYQEDYMGLSSDAVGIKFNDRLQQYIKENDSLEQKEKRLVQLENKTLLKRLLLLRDAKTYFYESHLSIAYLQTFLAIDEFIAVSVVAQKDKKYIDIIVNYDKFILTKYMGVFLMKYGVRKISFYTSSGQLRSCSDFPQQDESVKEVRLFAFKGISEKDRLILSSLSSVTGASGDNSFSDLQGLPFCYLPDWKLGLMHHFIYYVSQQKDIEYNTDLMTYCCALLECQGKKEKTVKQTTNYASVDMISFLPVYECVEKKQVELRQAFMAVRERIYRHHNAKDSFIQLINTFIVLQLSQSTSCQSLFDIILSLIRQTVKHSEYISFFSRERSLVLRFRRGILKPQDPQDHHHETTKTPTVYSTETLIEKIDLKASL